MRYLLVSLFFVAIVTAQEPAPEKKEEAKPDDAKAQADMKPEAKQQAEAPPQEDPKKIIERLHKNMESAEDRLDKKDSGDETRHIQSDIVDDLDKLIKQSQNNKGGGGGSSTRTVMRKKSSSSKGSQKNDSAQNNPSEKKSGGGKGGGKDPQTDKSNGNENDNPDQAAGGKPSQNPAGGGGGKNSNNKEENTVADLFRDVWGHLPLAKRQEMDAYAKERFMPKYDDLLRQYYRTIAEQGRLHDGE